MAAVGAVSRRGLFARGELVPTTRVFAERDFGAEAGFFDNEGSET